MKRRDIVQYHIPNASGRFGPSNPPTATVAEIGHDDVLLDFGHKPDIWVPRSLVTVLISYSAEPACGRRDCNRP